MGPSNVVAHPQSAVDCYLVRDRNIVPKDTAIVTAVVVLDPRDAAAPHFLCKPHASRSCRLVARAADGKMVGYSTGGCYSIVVRGTL